MKRQLLATALCALAAAIPAVSTAPAAAQAAPAGLSGQWEGEAETDLWPLFLNVELGGPSGDRLRLLGRTVKLARTAAADGTVTLTAVGDANPIILSGRFSGGEFVGRLRQSPADYPFRLRAVKTLPKPASRIEAWQQDLDTLDTRFLAADRSFSPAERAMFLEATAAIRRDLPRLDDAQVTARMAAAVALANNGHTRLYLLRNRQELRRLPIRLWWFSDGLHVVRADAQHAPLLGCRVDAIGGWTARHARDMAAPLFAGTPGWKDYKTVYSLTSPETLHGVGISPGVDAAEFTLSNCAAAGRHRLVPLPLVRSREPVEAWWDLSPLFQAPGGGWRHVLDDLGGRLPPYLQSQANYRFDYLPGSGIFYFQYNRSEQSREESTAAFGERLLAELAARKPRAFVLDLRFNTGGNLNYAEQLMKQLVERTAGLPRFVITGRATFSAGISAAVPWRRPGVTFVGEPIGDLLEYWSEGGNIALPNSGYDAHFANGMHKHTPGPCPEGVRCRLAPVEGLDPHLPATASFADYKSGRDPALEAVIAALRGR